MSKRQWFFYAPMLYNWKWHNCYQSYTVVTESIVYIMLKQRFMENPLYKSSVDNGLWEGNRCIINFHFYELKIRISLINSWSNARKTYDYQEIDCFVITLVRTLNLCTLLCTSIFLKFIQSYNILLVSRGLSIMPCYNANKNTCMLASQSHNTI